MSFKGRMESLLDMPTGSVTGDARLEIYGGRQVLIDGACSILHCEEDHIRLQTVGGVLCFRGRDLRLSAFSAAATTVEGRLCAVEFE